MVALLAWGHDDMHDHRDSRPVTLDELERFHGHIGPYVALGARMGVHAISEREIPKYFGLHVHVECPPEPPFSCLIDGLQAATGATMGKKNIEHIIADKIRVTITDTKTKKQVSYTIKQSIMDMMKEMPNTMEKSRSIRPQTVFHEARGIVRYKIGSRIISPQ